MTIKIFKDLKKFALTSTITKAEIEVVKQYKPDALKKKDADGNDIFAVSYVEGKPSVSAIGVTFGSASADGGYAMITGDLPATLKAGKTYAGFIADKVGAALEFVNEFEANLPAVAAGIRNARADLMNSVVEA